MENKNLLISLEYHEHSKHFFVNFSNAEGYIISLKISEGEAQSLSKALDVKIMM